MTDPHQPQSAPAEQAEDTPAQRQALSSAVADAQRKGWQVETYGQGWVRLGKYEPVNHVGMLLLTIITAGLGLIIWAYVANKGPQWRQLILSADAAGNVTVTHLDKDGRPRRE